MSFKNLFLALSPLALTLLVSCGDGAIETFHGNEKLKERWFEKKGEDGKSVKHGTYERFDEKGTKRDSLNYDMGKRSGIELMWHSNGAVSSKCNWTDSELDGACEKFDDNGQKIELVTWVKGKLNGPKVIWNKKGIKIEELYYKDGLQDSTYQRWNDAGVLKHLAHFKAGKREGEEKIWCEEDHRAEVIREQRIWVNGKREGIETYYVCLDGEISGILSWKDDMMDGPYTFWEEGKKIVEMYEKNVKIEKPVKGKKGKKK